MTVSVEVINPEEIAEEQFTDDWHAVKDAVDRLSDEPAYRKQILTMYFMERKTAKEISEETAFSPRSVETLVRRFREELR
jgi:DNA-directed RNA polymerase specialized sigma24 family protein